jgi:hypothetical protein
LNLGTILLDLALLGLVAYIVLRPLLNPAHGQDAQADPADDLLAERERLLGALRELEMDQATGKVTADDYAVLRPQLVAQGAAVLRQMDELAARPPRRKAQTARPVDDEIEAAIRQARLRRRSPLEASGRATCPQCGRAARPEDRFCAGCGAALAQAQPAVEAVR